MSSPRPRHRGLSRLAGLWHTLAAIGGEYGPRVQAHLMGRYLSVWLEVNR